MALKAQVTGTFSLIDEANSNNIDVGFDMASDFGTLQNIKPFAHGDIDVIDSDNDKPLEIGDATDAVGVYIRVRGGSIDLKHSGNPNPMRIDRAMALYGSITSPIVSTSSTTPVTVRFLFFK